MLSKLKARVSKPIDLLAVEMTVILGVSGMLGWAVSYGLDWYYWERDMVGFGSQTMYLQQATEAWVAGMALAVIFAVALAYGFIRLHRIRGD